MSFKGAGGTSGGVGAFLIGFLMMCAGGYMFLRSIIVDETFGLGMGLYHFTAFGGAVPVTSGMILIPLLIGVGMIFYNGRNLIGWALALGSLAAIIAGVIANLRFTFRTMSLFDLIVIVILLVGGLGLFLRSLQDYERDKAEFASPKG
jgi:hypothetical protein